jgi:Tol biopolymer transport system component
MNKLTVYACFSLAFLLATDASIASDDKVGVTSQNPAVSPTGQQLVFAADFDGPIRLWVSGLDGKGLRKVSSSSNPSTAVADAEPAWSPDGRQIIYTSSNGQDSDIWVMAVNGTYPSKLTSNGAKNTHPVWSPDGRKIAFVSDRDGTKDIWIMNADGSQQAKVLNSSGEENSPSFSPSGDRIVFSKTDGDAASLMIVNVDGTGLRALTTGNFRDWEPSWGNGGIVFSSNRDTTSERWKIWQVQPDGTGLHKVGDVPGHDPIWLPNGQIAFTDESMASKALAAVSILNPATGAKRVVADVQGYLTPIDVRPSNALNQINPVSMGRPEVAILSTRSLDATKAIVQRTITFGRTGAENSLVTCSKAVRDVNNDGLPDLICRFGLRNADFQMGNSVGILRFTDIRGVPYEGRDAITTVPEDDPNDFKN